MLAPMPIVVPDGFGAAEVQVVALPTVVQAACTASGASASAAAIGVSAQRTILRAASAGILQSVGSRERVGICLGFRGGNCTPPQ